MKPLSSLPGIQWPAIPSAKAATLLALQFQLEQSQWWTLERLRRAQFAQLAQLLEHARTTTPFYAERMQGGPTGKPRDWDASPLASVPLLTRRNLQTCGDTIFSRQYPGQHGPASSVMTSGSTGSPVTVLQTGVIGLFWQALTLRDHLWHKRDLSARLGVIRYVADKTIGRPPKGSSDLGWGPATDLIYPKAPLSLLTVGSPIEDQARWLKQEDPSYLLTHPSNLAALLHELEKGDLLPLRSLKQVRTLGESLSEDTRKHCRELLGVDIADMYSTQEVGYIALQCPETDNYHVQSESVYVEILNDDGTACKEGETGHVIVTSLHNFASPIIRYQVGDFAEVGGICACGRGLPTLRHIHGRKRGMFVRPDGRKVWPLITSKKCRRAAPYAQMQLIQESLQTVRVRLVPEGAFGEKEREALRATLLECLECEIDIEFDVVEGLERSKSGKFEEFVSYVPQGEAPLQEREPS